MVRKLIGVAVLLVILATVFSTEDRQPTTGAALSGGDVEALRTDMPPDEAAFVDAVERYANRSNDAISRHQRATELCATLATQILTGWVGTVLNFEADARDDTASLELGLSPHLTIGTYEGQEGDDAAHNDTQYRSPPNPISGPAGVPTSVNASPSEAASPRKYGAEAECFELKNAATPAAMADPDYAASFSWVYPH